MTSRSVTSAVAPITVKVGSKTYTLPKTIIDSVELFGDEYNVYELTQNSCCLVSTMNPTKDDIKRKIILSEKLTTIGVINLCYKYCTINVDGQEYPSLVCRYYNSLRIYDGLTFVDKNQKESSETLSQKTKALMEDFNILIRNKLSVSGEILFDINNQEYRFCGTEINYEYPEQLYLRIYLKFINTFKDKIDTKKLINFHANTFSEKETEIHSVFTPDFPISKNAEDRNKEFIISAIYPPSILRMKALLKKSVDIYYNNCKAFVELNSSLSTHTTSSFWELLDLMGDRGKKFVEYVLLSKIDRNLTQSLEFYKFSDVSK